MVVTRTKDYETVSTMFADPLTGIVFQNQRLAAPSANEENHGRSTLSCKNRIMCQLRLHICLATMEKLGKTGGKLATF